MRVRHLPEDAATVAAEVGRPAWTMTHQLLDELRMRVDAARRVPVKQIKPHPASPLAEKARTLSPEKAAALERVKSLAAAHEARWAPKEVTA